MKIALVSCTKLKAETACTAKEMYMKSNLFKKAVQYIEQQDYDDWFILSAKYGLLKNDDIIEPYDVTLNNMKASQRKEWANMVIQQIKELDFTIEEADFYAGKKYREYLMPMLEQKGVECQVPLKGKGIGQQLAYYSVHTK